jgi:hypothetical protein
MNRRVLLSRQRRCRTSRAIVIALCTDANFLSRLPSGAYIAVDKHHIDKQYRIIAELEGKGYDTSAAVALLERVQDNQDLHEQERQRLIAKGRPRNDSSSP